MTVNAILEKFSNLSGLSGDSLENWRYICEDSMIELRAKLREGVIEEDHDRILCASAAALSFYKYVLCILIRNDISSENMYSINGNVTRSIAYSLWNDYKSMISHLLIDDQFTFRGII